MGAAVKLNPYLIFRFLFLYPDYAIIQKESSTVVVQARPCILAIGTCSGL